MRGDSRRADTEMFIVYQAIDDKARERNGTFIFIYRKHGLVQYIELQKNVSCAERKEMMLTCILAKVSTIISIE